MAEGHVDEIGIMDVLTIQVVNVQHRRRTLSSLCEVIAPADVRKFSS